MFILNVFAVYFLLCTDVFVNCEQLLVPCHSKDLQCLRKSTKIFLHKTSKGIKSHGIKSIDPIHVPSVNVKRAGGPITYRDVVITGIKDLDLRDFNMNIYLQAVSFTALLNVKLQFTSPRGSIKYIDGKVLINTKYFYKIVKDKKGVEHFEVGPEMLHCTDIYFANEDKKNPYNKGGLSKDEQEPSVVCALATAAYATVVSNIRSAAKVLPVSAFIKD